MADRLADRRCSSLTDADVTLLASITGLSNRVVVRRLTSVHGNTLVGRALENDWPTDGPALSNVTVGQARRANLEDEIQAVTGLGLRSVRSRLQNQHGRMQLMNAFPELLDAEEDEEEEDEEEGEEDEEVEGDTVVDPSWQPYANAQQTFRTLDLVGAIRAMSARRAPGLLDWLAPRAHMSRGKLAKLVSAANGRTYLRTILQDAWPIRVAGPSRTMLGSLTSGAARESASLMRWIADVAGLDPQETYERLRDAHWRKLVRNAIPELDEPQGADDEDAEDEDEEEDEEEEQEQGTKTTGRGRRTRRADSAPPPSSPRGGRTIGDRYEILRKIGKGAFGAVYEARRVGSKHLLAIKTALPGKPDRLRDEMDLAWDLRHQNICAYVDVGSDPKLGTYLVMTHGGRSLDHIIDEGVVELERAFDILEQVAAGLDYAHSRGVIHHDIKPQNILVRERGRHEEVCIADFGIAQKGKLATNTRGSATVFGTAPIGLTEAYAPPEQLMGAKARKASDQYSLALVLCSMLEGELFESRYKPRDFSRLKAPQNKALKRALDPDPNKRFPSCREFAAAVTER